MPSFNNQNTTASDAAKAEEKKKKDPLQTILEAFAPKAGKPKEEKKEEIKPAEAAKPAQPAPAAKPAQPAPAAKPAAGTAQFAKKPASPAGMPSNIPHPVNQAKPARPAGMPSNIPNQASQAKPAQPAPAAPKAALKAPDVIAKEVIRGDWGNGAERKAKLEAAGYSYDAVQAEVNRQMRGAAPSNLDDVARRVIRGEFGNGAERRAKLEAAGYDFNAVQARVNQLLK